MSLHDGQSQRKSERAYELRHEKKLSIDQVAERMGVTRSNARDLVRNEERRRRKQENN